MESVLQPVDVPTGDDDLRPYVRLIARRYRTILAVALLASIAGLLATFVIPRTYEADALVASTNRQYILSFDSRFSETNDRTQTTSANGLLALATGDEVLTAVAMAKPPGVPASLLSAESLRRIMSASLSTGNDFVILKVRAPQPDQAAAIANAWADAVVARGREVYGLTDQDLQYLNSRQLAAKQDLAKADAALADFQAHSQLSSLNAQVKALGDQQETYLADRDEVLQLRTAVRGLRSRLESYPSDAKVAPGDDLTALLLEAKAYNANSEVPIQFQVGGAIGNGSVDASDLRAALDGLDSQLASRSDFDDARLKEIQSQILLLQGQIQQAQNEADRLTLQRDIAKENYQALTRQVEGLRSAAETVNAGIRVASRAVSPRDPVLSRGLIVAIGGAVGLLLGISVVLIEDWWRAGEDKSARNAVASQAEAESHLDARTVGVQIESSTATLDKVARH